MKEQKDLQIIKIDEIMINPENPRHNEVQLTIPGMGEELIMKQLIRDKESANKMFDLIKSIYESGFIPSLGVILEYRENINKYIPWDGNRRITALKILKNPSIMEELKYFTYAQKNTIFEFSKKVQEDFFEVSAYIVQNFEEAAPIIKSIHTTTSGTMQWDRIMIKRFEQKLGLKNILTQVQDLLILNLLPNVFKDLPSNFPTSTLDKILNSNEGKKFLNIDNIDNVLTFTSSMRALASEIQRSSKTNGYRYYPISYCFLIRSLLEQTSIYFLINTNKWNKLIKGKNRDLNLGEIIKYILILNI